MLRIRLWSFPSRWASLGCFWAAICMVSVQWTQGQEAANDQARPKTKINEMLARLNDQFAQKRFGDGWAQGLREIVEMGPEAVPDLIVELDATDDDIMLRNLGFLLRAIGDKRAVPALIRALPKTLRKPGSDMGLRAEDAELMAFMQKHDLDATNRDKLYSFGRPVREIGGALQKLTGVKQDEEELYHVFRQGGLLQQHMQRLLFHRCAQRWADWWEKNWREHISDAKYALVQLPAEEALPVKLFPSGPGVKIEGRSSGHTAEPEDDPNARREVFYDLDTGRMLALPKELQALKDDPNRLDKIQNWAAREGFDLMGTMYHHPGSERPYYAIRGLGLTAWEVDTARFRSIAGEIKKEDPIVMGRPAGGLLLHFDPERNAYDPTATAAFLFLTRESTYGALFVGVEVLDTNVKLGMPMQGDQALNPVGFSKGRRFSFQIVDSGQGDDQAK